MVKITDPGILDEIKRIHGIEGKPAPSDKTPEELAEEWLRKNRNIKNQAR